MSNSSDWANLVTRFGPLRAIIMTADDISTKISMWSVIKTDICTEYSPAQYKSTDAKIYGTKNFVRMKIISAILATLAVETVSYSEFWTGKFKLEIRMPPPHVPMVSTQSSAPVTSFTCAPTATLTPSKTALREPFSTPSWASVTGQTMSSVPPARLKHPQKERILTWILLM